MLIAARPEFVWRLRSCALEVGRRTVVMGILNVTPDSFSDGGHFYRAAEAPERAVRRALEMLDEGARIVDVGGESTRPGAAEMTGEEERARVLPVIRGILARRPGAILSIDTYHAETARLAVEAGAEIVNDVSGMLWDEAMAATCAELECGVVVMHTRGRPAEWRGLPPLADGAVVPMVLGGLSERVAEAEAAGVARERMAVDPGFGFGKRMDENFPLLAGMGRMRELGLPVVAGMSRKSFLAKAMAESELLPDVQAPPDQRLHATIAANVIAMAAGAHVLRVHDVRAAVEAGAVVDRVLEVQG